jgi:hypothetical protein
MNKRTFGACAIVAAGTAVVSVAGMQATLDRAGLMSRVVGNTIHYHAPNEDVYEYLAPGGRILGESTVHGKYVARWRLFQSDAICFEHDDPMASGCVAAGVAGEAITYYRRDGVIEGPFELLAGNPRKL